MTVLVGGARVAALAWITPDDARRFAGSDAARLVDAAGRTLAEKDKGEPEPMQASTDSFLIIHPWDLLTANSATLARIRENRLEGEVSSRTHIDGVLVVGAGTRVLPGVVVEGRVVIGAGCKIGPNAYLRGDTAIGDGCHVGQAVEIKNSILGKKTNVGHLGYVGDSILGDGVNFGAGTVVSNLRHDGGNHRTFVDGQLVDTGRRKFGTVVGDGVHTGIHTSIYPGRKLGPGTMTRPGEVVAEDVVGFRE